MPWGWGTTPPLFFPLTFYPSSSHVPFGSRAGWSRTRGLEHPSPTCYPLGYLTARTAVGVLFLAYLLGVVAILFLHVLISSSLPCLVRSGGPHAAPRVATQGGRAWGHACQSYVCHVLVRRIWFNAILKSIIPTLVSATLTPQGVSEL